MGLSLLFSALLLCQSAEADAAEAAARRSAKDGDYVGAIAQHERALALRQSSGDEDAIATSLVELGNCHLALGEHQQALDHYRRALGYHEKLGKQVRIGAELRAMASCHAALGQYAEAISLEERSLPICSLTDTPQEWCLALARLAMNHAALGQHEQALQSFAQCAEQMNRASEPRQIILPQQEDPFARWSHILPALASSAFAMQQGGSATAAAESLNVLLALTGPRPRNEWENVRGVALTDIKANVGPDDAVLVYLVRGESYVWVLTSDDVKLIALGDRRPLAELQNRLLARLANPASSAAEIAPPARELSSALLPDAESLIASKKNLIIVPDGFLNALPFDVLLTRDVREAETQDMARLPYLVREKTVSYLPALAWLAPLAPPQPELDGMTMLLLGAPIDEPSLRSSLPSGDSRITRRNARPELLAIARQLAQREPHILAKLDDLPQSAIVDGRRFRLVTGSKATKVALRSRAASILHLAPHRLFDEQAPWLSDLVLSVDPYDGSCLLNFPQFGSSWDQFDLAFLSASGTNRGMLSKSYGWSSPARTFLVSGTRHVIATQWDVAEASMPAFVTTFYERVLAGESYADALRHAKLSFLERAEFAHPFFWAGFVLIGR